MTKYFILGTQRSGTSLLKTYLASHKNIKSFGELFHHSKTIAIKHKYKNQESVSEFLDAIYANDEDNLVTGFKLMYDQTVRYKEIVPWLIEHKVYCIYIERKNILKLYISKLLAKQTNIWVMRKEPLQQVDKIYIKTSILLHELNEIVAEQHHLQSIRDEFSNNITVYYEDILKEQEKTSTQLLEFLSLPVVSLASPLKKINSDDIAKIVINYDELKKVLRGTNYEGMLY